MKKLTTALAVALLAAACTPAPGTVDPAKRISVRGAVVVPGEAYKLLAAEQTRVPFELRRLAKIEVWVDNTEDLDPAFEAGELLPMGSGDADHTFDDVVLTDLQPSTTYTVRLKAWQYDPKADAEVQVDLNDAGESETTFDTDGAGLTDAANEEVRLTNGFKLTLKDQDFAGLALGGDLAASTTDGVLNPPVGSPAFAQPGAIADLSLLLFVDSTGMHSVDDDIRVWDEDDAMVGQYHTSNPCGGGFACGTPGDPDYEPTTGSFLLTAPSNGRSTRIFEVTTVPGAPLTTFVLKYDFVEGKWKVSSYDDANDRGVRLTPAS